jgi:enoyl-CoA hydratase/carnithine racemase
MPYENYSCLKIRTDHGVAFVTIDHPPINLFDAALIQELDRIGKELEDDRSIRVIVFQSADPEFFIAHADVKMIQQLPTTVPPKSTALGPFHQMVDRFRTMPKATIGMVEGRARGGGSEFLLSLDMRFGALGRAILGQPEVAVGIIPGGSGTQRLPRLIGRGRALEVILGCQDFPAELAEHYGYINRALPPQELTPFVERLAYRIASFPAEAIALAKAAVNAAELPTVEGLLEEEHYFYQSLATEEAQKRMAKFMELGGQTRQAEVGSVGSFDELVAELA